MISRRFKPTTRRLGQRFECLGLGLLHFIDVRVRQLSLIRSTLKAPALIY